MNSQVSLLQVLEEGVEQRWSRKQLKQIHAQAITQGMAGFSYISCKLLAACARNDIPYAHTLFSHITFPTLFHYNALITSSPVLLRRMLRTRTRPNAATFALTVSRSSHSVSFLQQLHSLALRLGHAAHLHVATALLSAYSRHALLHPAAALFRSTPRTAAVISAMLSAYVRNKLFPHAIRLFRAHPQPTPSPSLFPNLLTACTALNFFQQGKALHSYSHHFPGGPYQLHLGTSFIQFYTRFGCVQPARNLFDKMPHKDCTAWTAMISGLATNGCHREALHLFSQMKTVGPTPNSITFVAALTACNHPHLYTKSLELFKLMTEKYSIAPSIQHCGCVVQALARSGDIEEAVRFVKSMPVEPDAGIWGCLVDACLLHGYVELGEKVGACLVELEPEHSGRYVVLSNLYASLGRWEAVLETRELMKERGVAAVSALSFIEIHQTVNKLPQLKEKGVLKGMISLPNAPPGAAVDLSGSVFHQGTRGRGKRKPYLPHEKRFLITRNAVDLSGSVFHQGTRERGKRKPYLPHERRFLITRNVPYLHLLKKDTKLLEGKFYLMMKSQDNDGWLATHGKPKGVYWRLVYCALAFNPFILCPIPLPFFFLQEIKSDEDENLPSMESLEISKKGFIKQTLSIWELRKMKILHLWLNLMILPMLLKMILSLLLF
ncbi:hypothetical protein VNO78_12473 [Psophocarpus tetragonolobus]|uniref:Pentatricopeptide repeat-containing protein n=1 Tax=Psophocarpus tetragonolobus TaxID=3891 RepID=A0AAN9XPG5_PSOTE